MTNPFIIIGAAFLAISVVKAAVGNNFSPVNLALWGIGCLLLASVF